MHQFQIAVRVADLQNSDDRHLPALWITGRQHLPELLLDARPADLRQVVCGLGTHFVVRVAELTDQRVDAVAGMYRRSHREDSEHDHPPHLNPLP